MARKKVKLVFLANDSARRASLKKRRAGLIKKVSELTILCGVSAFIKIYSPDDPEPMVWPSKSVVEQLMGKYWTMSEMECGKKMMNQQRYLKDRVSKFEDQAKKQERKIRELELAFLVPKMYQDKGGAGIESEELFSLLWLVDNKMKEITKKASYFEQLPPLDPDINVAGPVHAPGRGGGIYDDSSVHQPANASVEGQWFGSNAGGSSSNNNNIAAAAAAVGGAHYGSYGGDGGNLSDLFTLEPMPDYGGADRFDPGLHPSSYGLGLVLHPSSSSYGLGLGLQPDPANLGAAAGGGRGGGGLGLGLDGAGTSSGDVGLPGFYGGPSDPYSLTNSWPYPPSPPPPPYYNFYP